MVAGFSIIDLQWGHLFVKFHSGQSVVRFAAFAVLAGGLAVSMPVGAQTLDDFTFDAEACSFGPSLDAMFDDLQERFDAEIEELGFERRTFDNGVETELRSSQPVNMGLGGLRVTNIEINYENRAVFFADDHERVYRYLAQRGTPFNDDLTPNIYGVIESSHGILDNALLSEMDEAEYNPDTRQMEPVPHPLGSTRLLCTLDRFVREANEAGENVSDFARVTFDPAIWDNNAAGLAASSDELFAAGDFSGAREASTALLAQLDSVGGQGSIEYVAALRNHARNLRALGQSTQARGLLQRALALAEETLGVEHSFATDVLADYAFVLADTGEAQEAVPLLNRVKWLRRDRFGENAPQTLEAHNRFGMAVAEVAIDDGSYIGYDGELTLGDAQSDIEIAYRGNVETYGIEHPTTLSSMIDFALVLSEWDLQADFDSWQRADALSFLAHTRAAAIYGPSHPETLRAANVRATVSLNKNSQLGLGALEPAREAVALVRQRSAALQTTPADQAQRRIDMRTQRLSFENFLDASWEQEGYDANYLLGMQTGRYREDLSRFEGLDSIRPEVFTAMQQAMSSSTDRAVAEAAARRVAARQDSSLGDLVARRQMLADEWVELDSIMAALLASETDQSVLRAQLRQRQTEIDNETALIDARLRSDAPQYFEFVSQQALGEAEAMALMGPDDAALIVVPTRYGTHVMVVTSNSVTWNRADMTREQIDRSVLRLLWDVGATVEVDDYEAQQWAQEGEGAYPFDRTTAHTLYNALIAPVAHLLKGKDHLYIAASGSLSSLPFGVLVTDPPIGPDGDPNSLRKTTWFADAHALVQVPTLQSLQMQRMLADTRLDRDGRGSFVGFGDPVLEGGAVTRGGGAARRMRGGTTGIRSSSASLAGVLRDGSSGVDVDAIKSMARLPGTSREINALAELFDESRSQVYLAEDATEPNLRNADLSSVRVLALATHGLLAGELDGVVEPGLVFTPPDAASSQNDGFLSASEVAALELAAEWVILSACNTASGDGSEGAPGLSGLARAFFFAGAESLLASHWPVRDDVAARLTVRMVELTQDDPSLSRAEALQAAMREIRSDASQDSADDTLAHPNAWAPFTLIGDR
ncbi:CHAT domain-containing protein [Erythrobacter sp. Dej080120_24]|uniref:CHAT domain-containing protein n=1 Tax=Erythrobacter sp. Dej080120_24 TaxID=3024837 RepID=UPI0030C74EE2